MDVPDLRHFDFDTYRQRAADLRAETINQEIGRAMNYLRTLLRPRPRPATGKRIRAPHCPA